MIVGIFIALFGHNKNLLQSLNIFLSFFSFFWRPIFATTSVQFLFYASKKKKRLFLFIFIFSCIQKKRNEEEGEEEKRIERNNVNKKTEERKNFDILLEATLVCLQIFFCVFCFQVYTCH